MNARERIHTIGQPQDRIIASDGTVYMIEPKHFKEIGEFLIEEAARDQQIYDSLKSVTKGF